MLIFYRFEPDDAYKKNAYKKKRVLKFLGQRSPKPFPSKKKLSYNEFWMQKIVSHRFRETNTNNELG